MAQDSADFMSHLEDFDTALDKLECGSKNIEWSTFNVKLGIDFRGTENEWLEQELRKLLPLATHIISKNYHKEVQKTHNFLTKYCYVQWGPQIYRIYAKVDETGNDKHRPITIVKKMRTLQHVAQPATSQQAQVSTQQAAHQQPAPQATSGI